MAELIRVGQSHWETKLSALNAITGGLKLHEQGTRVVDMQYQVKNLTALIRKFEQCDRNSRIEMPDIEHIIKVRKEADLMAETRRGLSMLIEEIQVQQIKIEKIADQLNEHSEQLTKLQKQIKRCPTCNQPLKKDPQQF